MTNTLSIRPSFRFVFGMLGACLLSAAVARPADAAVLSKVDQKCRDAIAKNFAKAVLTADKVSLGCHKSIYFDVSPLDCNDMSPTEADADLKFLKATTKLQDKIAKSCANASNAVLSRFNACPEPCRTSSGVSQPLANFTQVGQCLGCLAGDIVLRRNTVMLGDPTTPIGSAEVRCHASIGKGYSKHLKTALKVRQKCQKTSDKAGQLELDACEIFDDGSIDASRAGAESIVGSGCDVATLSEVDSCHDASIMMLQMCLTAEENPRAAEAFEAGYELPSTCNNGVFDVGEEFCESGGVDLPGCDYDCTEVICGDGHANTALPEPCDGGQCCTETCTFKPVDTPCDDGSICTTPDTCNGAGSCLGDPAPIPIDACTQADAGGSQLKLRNKGAKDQLSWSWGKNLVPLNMGSFNDPTTNGFTLCMYTDRDGSEPDPGPHVFRSISLPDIGVRWTNKNNKKFQYKDKSLSPHGVSSAQLKPGNQNKAKIKVKAKGANLGFSDLGLIKSTVTLQLRNTGTCFGAEFTGTITDPKFKGKN